MAPLRLSRLQKRILLWLVGDEKRSRGMIASSHQELIGALPSAKGNISHSLRLLEAQGCIAIGRTLGGKAESVYLTAAGHQRVANLSEVMNKECSMPR
jgi:DNA-binding MarR family transcriptional regulator